MSVSAAPAAVATPTRSVLVRVRRPRQVAVGAVVLVGAVGVVLGVGRRRQRRRAVVLVRAGLDVAAVVFRHLRPVERAAQRSDSLISDSRSRGNSF